MNDCKAAWFTRTMHCKNTTVVFFCCFVGVLALWYSILFLKIPDLTQLLHFYSAPSSGLLIFAMNVATTVF